MLPASPPKTTTRRDFRSSDMQGSPSIQISRLKSALKLSGVLLLACLTASALCFAESLKSPIAEHPNDLRDNTSPWGVASGSEWFSAYPVFNPMLKQAGVQWLRGFYEWQTIQPRRGYWNFTLPDRLIENARSNNISLTGVLGYLSPWTSADGGTRKFPIRDIEYWRDYVSGMVERYHSNIKYWEVWNEFDGSFAENGTPEIYAQLVREASIAAKAIDPTAKIGMSVANFDVGFLDAAIKAGAANYFDYICIHPYEKLANLSRDGEIEFLNMSATLRKMLISNNQPGDMQLWITEIGSPAPVSRSEEPDEAQAVILAKAYILSIASGFRRVFWFEARGPSRGNQRDFGLIRSDMTPRPSYSALKTLSGAFGSKPVAAGWLNVRGGYGFLFDTEEGSVLAAWAPSMHEITISFTEDVRVHDLIGTQISLPAGKALTVRDSPILITHLPEAIVEEARANMARPYPWAGDYAQAQAVNALLQKTNIENGIKQINPATTISEGFWRRTNFSRSDLEGHYLYFSVDQQFASFGTRSFEITAVVRRISTDKVAGMSLNYESQRGYVDTAYRNIPESDAWHEITWKVGDANFVGAWGWNFRINAISSPNEFLIKEIRLKKTEKLD